MDRFFPQSDAPCRFFTGNTENSCTKGQYCDFAHLKKPDMLGRDVRDTSERLWKNRDRAAEKEEKAKAMARHREAQ